MPGRRLAIDVGGTFVDFVLLDETTGGIVIDKELSDAGSLPAAILRGIDRLRVNLRELDSITHGSTVVINTILQQRGARIGMITTEGFRDVLHLGRGNRPEVYNLLYKPPEALIPRYLRFEVPERLAPGLGRLALVLQQYGLGNRHPVGRLVRVAAQRLLELFASAATIEHLQQTDSFPVGLLGTKERLLASHLHAAGFDRITRRW